MFIERSSMTVIGAALLILGATAVQVEAAVQPGETITWVGGASGDWINDTNVWRRSSDNAVGNALTIFGTRNGSDGANTSPTAGETIIIGGGAMVEYLPATPDLSVIYGDFCVKQGSNLIIRDGAVWAQLPVDGFWPGVTWTEMDASNLILDGGTFRRQGEAGGVGGALLLLGSWKADDNFSQLPAPAMINILIKNGGRLENQGDLWFGSGDDTPDDGLQVAVMINNGTIDLTGGDTFQEDQYVPATADLMFTYSLKNDFTPVNEHYEINFTGPGSITVDHSGIIVAKQDPTDGIWKGRTPADDVTTLVTYEQLWSDGLLKSKGMSGRETILGSGIPSTAFANHFTVTGTPGSDNYTLTRKNPTVVTWDGGTGNWSSAAKWNTGQTAFAVIGTNSGTDGGKAIVLDGSKPGGAAVTYTSAGYGDFSMNVGQGVSSLTIKNGASLTVHSTDSRDGWWTRYNGDLILDGGTFRRTRDATSLNGGLFMLGSFGQRWGQEIDVTLTNGGRLENDGQLWFGAPGSGGNATDLEVTVTINGGTIDLTGGDTGTPDSGPDSIMNVFFGLNPDLVFAYLYRASDDNTKGPYGLAGEKYVINFTGPGSLTVDHSGIYVLTETDSSGVGFTADDKSYQELWQLGILQANGLSGLDGAVFGDYFTTTGTLGMDNYKLTSLIGAGLAGDYNGNGTVDAADCVAWRNNPAAYGGIPAGYNTWRANFGSTGGSGASLGEGVFAVPEPNALLLLLAGTTALFTRRRAVRV